MNCQNCGAPLRTASNRDYSVCDYCTTVAFREPDVDGIVVLGENSVLPCPICQRTLVTALVNDTDILFCDRCRGILCDQPAFGAVTRELRGSPVAPMSTPRPSIAPIWNALSRARSAVLRWIPTPTMARATSSSTRAATAA